MNTHLAISQPDGYADTLTDAVVEEIAAVLDLSVSDVQPSCQLRRDFGAKPVDLEMLRWALEKRWGLFVLYRSRGPLADQEAADTLRIQRCAVNARRASLIKLGLVDPEPKGTRKNPRTGVRNASWGLV